MLSNQIDLFVFFLFFYFPDYLTVKLRNNSCNAKSNKVPAANQLHNQKIKEKNDQVLLENLFTSIHGSSYYQYLNYD